MSNFLPFLITGLVSGAVYGLAGTGLVLTYKTSGIFNFAYGSVAAIAVFVFYWLHTQHGLPWPVAGALCVFVLSPIEGILFELMARRIERRGVAVQVVATVALMLVVLGVGGIWYGSQALSVPQYLPQGRIKISGVYVTWAEIIVFVVAVVGVAALYYFFRWVRLGVAMRGVVDDPELVALRGESPDRVRRLAWIIGTVFATVAGLLVSPSLGLDATVITLLVVQAFGAAAIGYLSSLPLTFLGGLIIGVGSAFATKYTVTVSWLSGLAAGLPFILLFLVLVFMPPRLLAQRRARNVAPVQRPWHAPPRTRGLVAIIAIALLFIVPPAMGWALNLWATFMVDTILFLSLGLLVRSSGQISFCHLTFAAIGAAAFGHFAGQWHIPWLVAILCAGLIAVPVGAIIAVPAIRLSGVFLAVATLGFAILVENLFFTTNMMFGPTTTGLVTPAPDISVFGLWLNSPKGFYYVCVVFAVVTAAVIISIESGRMGRLLGALSSSPTALEVQGTDVNVTKTLVFCIAAGIAGIAGALTGATYGYAVGTDFEWFVSVEFVVLVLIVVGGTPWFALLGAVGTAIIPGYLTFNNVTYWSYIVFGAFAMIYAIQGGQKVELPKQVQTFALQVDRWLGGGRRQVVLAGASTAGVGVASGAAPPPLGPAAGNGGVAEGGVLSPVGAEPDGDSELASRLHQTGPDGVASGAPETDGFLGLEVRDLSVHYGGVRALVNANLVAPRGMITGLVGPNGAGKTTMFNACSGLVRPSAGRVFFDSADITHVGRARRAQRRLGRTFQRTELFDTLTVRENVAIGREASMAGSNPMRQLAGRRGDWSVVTAAVGEALELAGITDLADQQASLLTTGQRRLVELARVLAGPFTLVLLDEPSAGLDSDETVRFGETLQRVVADRGIGILLVEHDLALVRTVCSEIYVLDFGQMIFHGSSDDMLNSDLVRAAYLGSDAVVTQMAGGAESSEAPEEAGERI